MLPFIVFLVIFYGLGLLFTADENKPGWTGLDYKWPVTLVKKLFKKGA